MGVASAGTSGSGGRPVLPCGPCSDRGALLQSVGAAALATTDFRAWQTRYLGRSGERSARQRAEWPCRAAEPLPFQLVFTEHRFH